MHRDDCISDADLYGGEWVPTYYCEDCGRELHYPPESGCCLACELTHETNEDGDE